MAYSYGIPNIAIYLIHILIGIWLISIGYRMIKKQKLQKPEKSILIIIGGLAIIYQTLLWIQFPKRNYNCNTPGWIIHLLHIIIGAILIWAATAKNQNIKNVLGAIILIGGGLAIAYHLHIWFLKKKGK